MSLKEGDRVRWKNQRDAEATIGRVDDISGFATVLGSSEEAFGKGHYWVHWDNNEQARHSYDESYFWLDPVVELVRLKEKHHVNQQITSESSPA